MANSTEDLSGESRLRSALGQFTVGRDGADYIVGRADVGVYVAIPRPGVVLIDALCNGASLAEASAQASAEAGEEVDVDDFLTGLGDLGLLDTPHSIGSKAPAGARIGWVERIPRRIVRPLFGRIAWLGYVAATLTTVLLLVLRPDLRPLFDDVWFLTDPIWSMLALVAISVAITAVHESWHWLAGRALGVPARFRVSRRGIFVVFESDLSQLVTLPRRSRYSPLLAGMAFDVVLLAAALLLRLGFREEYLDLPPALDRFLGAIVFRQIVVLIWQLAGVAFRSDSYAVLANALGCHNLFRATALTVKYRLRRLDGTEVTELASMSSRDCSVANWFWLVYLAGGFFMYEVLVTYMLPFSYGMIGWVVPNIAALAVNTLVFWESAALVALLVAQFAIVPFIARRERRARRPTGADRVAPALARSERSRYGRAWQLVFVVLVVVVAVQTSSNVRRYVETSFDATAADIAAAAADNGCLPGRRVPLLDFPHVSQRAAASVVYNSNPPTSGPHYAAALAPGIYRTPLAAGQTVHALEHGRVVIHYLPDTPPDVVRQLESIAKRYARDTVVTPNPDLDTQIGLAAWGRVDTLDQFDEERIVRFVDMLRGRYNHHSTAAQSDCRAQPEP